MASRRVASNCRVSTDSVGSMLARCRAAIGVAQSPAASACTTRAPMKPLAPSTNMRRRSGKASISGVDSGILITVEGPLSV
jgi:hypothetical protein